MWNDKKDFVILIVIFSILVTYSISGVGGWVELKMSFWCFAWQTGYGCCPKAVNQYIISLSCHEQVCLSGPCSWHDKLIILWTLNRQAKISLSVFQIIRYELVTIYSLYYYENIRSWHSASKQAVLKSQIWLKTTFSNSKWLWMKTKWDKSTFLQISGDFWTN